MQRDIYFLILISLPLRRRTRLNRLYRLAFFMDRHSKENFTSISSLSLRFSQPSRGMRTFAVLWQHTHRPARWEQRSHFKMAAKNGAVASLFTRAMLRYVPV